MTKFNQPTWLFSVLGGIYLIFWGIIGHDPFFGDAISTVSRCALNIFDNNFTVLTYPKGLDPGHPTTFPILYALIWKVVGLGLWQSHLINVLFSFGIVFRVVQWLRYEGVKYVWLGPLLLFLTVQFVAQSALMNTHLPLTFFVISVAWSIKTGRAVTATIWAVCLVLTHLQGLYYFLPMLVWAWFIQSGNVRERLQFLWPIMLFPLLAFLGWAAYHHGQTGWWISSPDYAAHRGTPDIKGIIRNLILSDWRISDYGQIALFIVPFFVMWKRRFRFNYDHALILFAFLYVFNAVAIAITTHTGPAHRYVFPAIPFLILATAEHLPEFKWRTWIAVFGILASGYVWFYPGKTLGDSTLTYRQLFPILNELKSDYPSDTIYTYAPVGNYSRSMYLADEVVNTAPLYNRDKDSCRFILSGNLIGDFAPEELDSLRISWSVTSFERGNAWFELYQNPKFGRFPIEHPREKSSAEIWMEKLKSKLK